MSKEYLTVDNKLIMVDGKLVEVPANTELSDVLDAQESEIETTQSEGDKLVDEIVGYVDGSPRGVYASLSALQTAFPSGTSGVYLTSDNGHWYYYNNGWKDGGVYQAVEVADNSISTRKLASGAVSYSKLKDYLTNNENWKEESVALTFDANNCPTTTGVTNYNGWDGASVDVVAGELYHLKTSTFYNYRAFNIMDSSNKVIAYANVDADRLVDLLVEIPLNGVRMNVLHSTSKMNITTLNKIIGKNNLSLEENENVINDAKSFLEKYYDYKEINISWIDGKTIGDNRAVQSVQDAKYSVLPVKKGEKYKIENANNFYNALAYRLYNEIGSQRASSKTSNEMDRLGNIEINIEFDGYIAVSQYSPYGVTKVFRFEYSENKSNKLVNGMINNYVKKEIDWSTAEDGYYSMVSKKLSELNSTFRHVNIECSGMHKIKIYGYVFYNVPIVAFLDASKNCISTYPNSSSTSEMLGVEIDVPSNAKYISVCQNIDLLSYQNGVQRYNRFEYLDGYKAPNYFDSNPLNGKKWIVFGDSITAHSGNALYNYDELIYEKTGILNFNFGVGGSGYYAGGNSNRWYNRVSSIPSDAEIITLFGSINDVAQISSVGLGTSSDTVDNGTIAGYINGTLDKINTSNPLAKLGIISPLPTEEGVTGNMLNFTNLLKEICEKRSIPFLNLLVSSNLRPWNSTFKATYYNNGDGVHPNVEGHKLFANRILEFVKTL